MKKFSIFFWLIAIIFSIVTMKSNSQSTLLKKSVFGNGGMVGISNSKDIKINILAGQFVIGYVINLVPGSTNYNLNQGFWVPEPKKESSVESQTLINKRDLFNYPNPVNFSTTIEYNIKNGGNVTLKIYDMLGNEVKTLVNTYNSVGKYSVIWDTKNDNGIQVGSGAYMYEMQVNHGDLSGSNASNNYILHNIMVIAK